MILIELSLTQYRRIVLSPKMRFDLVDVIMETGWAFSADEYIQRFYNKTFDELTVCEAEMIIKNLKPGDLFEPVKKSEAVDGLEEK